MFAFHKLLVNPDSLALPVQARKQPCAIVKVVGIVRLAFKRLLNQVELALADLFGLDIVQHTFHDRCPEIDCRREAKFLAFLDAFDDFSIDKLCFEQAFCAALSRSFRIDLAHQTIHPHHAKVVFATDGVEVVQNLPCFFDCAIANQDAQFEDVHAKVGRLDFKGAVYGVERVAVVPLIEVHLGKHEIGEIERGLYVDQAFHHLHAAFAFS